MAKKIEPQNNIVIYQTSKGALALRGDIKHETIWATQAQIADIFGVNSQAITKHIKNIYQEGELFKEATCSKMEQVRVEGGRTIRRSLDIYSLDIIISAGYRINSNLGTKFRQWATKTLRSYIVDGYAIDRSRVQKNYTAFMEAVAEVRALLPTGSSIDNESILELISLFSDTWLSLEAYDTDRLEKTGISKKSVKVTADQLTNALTTLKVELIKKGEATDLFGAERHRESIAGIVGDVMQSFGGKPVYATIEEKAAHILYFIVKNHPFVDGNKRNGAYAFIWYLQKAGILDITKITPPALTALTLLVAESEAAQKERMIRLILQLLRNSK